MLKAYRAFLLGESHEDLDISDSDIAKMKIFHEKLVAGHSYYNLGKTLRLPEFLARGMWLMFSDWQEGREIRILYNANKSLRTAKVYELMLDGMSEHKLRLNGYTDAEIEKANVFREYESFDMLPKTVAQQTGLLVSTIKKMQRLYKDKRTEPEEIGTEIKVGVIA
jgi:hypothetical protein